MSNTGWYGFPANKNGIVKVANHGPGRKTHPNDDRTTILEEEVQFRDFLKESLPGLSMPLSSPARPAFMPTVGMAIFISTMIPNYLAWYTQLEVAVMRSSSYRCWGRSLPTLSKTNQIPILLDSLGVRADPKILTIKQGGGEKQLVEGNQG